jgi:hypothetical protein
VPAFFLPFPIAPLFGRSKGGRHRRIFQIFLISYEEKVVGKARILTLGFLTYLAGVDKMLPFFFSPLKER